MSNVIDYKSVLNGMIEFLSSNDDSDIDFPEDYYWKLNKLMQWSETEIKTTQDNLNRGGSDD